MRKAAGINIKAANLYELSEGSLGQRKEVPSGSREIENALR